MVAKRYLDYFGYVEDCAHERALEALIKQEESAVFYPLHAIPADVIRLYSRVTLSTATGWKKTLQIVLPTERDTDGDCLSVQSMLGASLIGYAEGDEVTVGAPLGEITIRVMRVKQTDQYLQPLATAHEPGLRGRG